MNAQNKKGSEQNMNAEDLVGGASDKGPNRSENQDAFWIPDGETEVNLGLLYLVADGVGGQESGADAAQLAVQTARQKFYDSRLEGSPVHVALKEALLLANQAVFEEAQRRQIRRMGATFVAAAIEQDQLTIAHVGDARAYLIRQGGMRQLTRDDTWVQKQVEAGLLTAEQAAKHEYRNIVTQVLGNKPEVDVHLSKTHELQQTDQILLCSDGLYDALTDDEMLNILAGNTPSAAARKLVQDAVSAGASDNITAVVARLGLGSEIAAGSTVAEPMVLATAIDQQPTVAITMTDQPPLTPVQPETPPPAVKVSKTSNWLIVFAAAAVILILAAILLFWLRNRNLHTTVEEVAGTDMTASALLDSPTPTSAGALRPAPTSSSISIESEQTVTASTSSAEIAPTSTATEEPPSTPTLRPVQTVEPTLEPRGCANNRIVAFVWSQEQLDNGSCTTTNDVLEIGEEVRILEDDAVAGSGECISAQYLKVQSVSRPDFEGWVSEEAINLLEPGSSCNP